METVIAAALQAVGLVLVALLGIYGARRLGIGQNQDRLVSTLKDLIDAQDAKIAELEKSREENTRRIEELELRVAELTALTVNQALEIDHLNTVAATKRKPVVQKKITPEGGE